MSKPSATLQRALPRPYRARALWRGCKWAVDIRPWNGRTQANVMLGHDSETNNRGRLTGTISATPTRIRNGGRFANSNGGGAVGFGTGIQWEDWQWKAIPQTGIYEWLDTGGMSLACCMRFNAVPANNRRILTKRFGVTNNFHCGAISFSNTGGNRFEFSYCNGVATQSIFGTTVPTAGVTYVVVGRHWGNNALSRAELWVNGKLEAVNAAPATYPAYKKDPPILFFTDTGSGNDTLDGEASMGGLWARPLTTSEIQMLNVNPYALWESPNMAEGLPFAGPGGGLIGCNCCPGWLCAWNDM